MGPNYICSIKQNKLLWLIALLVFVRLLYNAFYPDEFSDILNRFGESYYKSSIGAIPEQLLCGNKTSIFNYQVQPYEGGSLVMGMLMVPFLLLFGDTMYSLWLVNIFVFSVGILILMFTLLKKYFSEEVATGACLLFIFAPPSYLAWSAMPRGNHFETGFFSLIILHYFCRIWFDNASRYEKLHAVAFGFLIGFGIYFSYTCAIAFICGVILSIILKRGKNFSANFLLYFSSGLFLGFIPWIIYGLGHNFNSLFIKDITDKPCFLGGSSIGLPRIFLKTFALISYALPRGLFGNSINILCQYLSSIFSYFYYLVFIIFAFFISQGKKKNYNYNGNQRVVTIFLLTFFSLYLFIYILSRHSTVYYAKHWWQNIELHPRHLFAIYPAMFMIIAISTWCVCAKALYRRIILALIIICFLGNVKLICRSKTVDLFRFKGGDIYSLAGEIIDNVEYAYAKVKRAEEMDIFYNVDFINFCTRQASNMPYYYSYNFFSSIMIDNILINKKDNDLNRQLANIIFTVDSFKPEYQRDAYLGLGYVLVRLERQGKYYLTDIVLFSERLRTNRKYFLNAMGFLIGEIYLENISECINYIENLHVRQADKIFLYEGLGEQRGKILSESLKSHIQESRSLPEPCKEAYWAGLGCFFGRKYGQCMDSAYVRHKLNAFYHSLYRGVFIINFTKSRTEKIEFDPKEAIRGLKTFTEL